MSRFAVKAGQIVTYLLIYAAIGLVVMFGSHPTPLRVGLALLVGGFGVFMLILAACAATPRQYR